jgi:hypothetical protein
VADRSGLRCYRRRADVGRAELAGASAPPRSPFPFEATRWRQLAAMWHSRVFVRQGNGSLPGRHPSRPKRAPRCRQRQISKFDLTHLTQASQAPPKPVRPLTNPQQGGRHGRLPSTTRTYEKPAWLLTSGRLGRLGRLNLPRKKKKIEITSPAPIDMRSLHDLAVAPAPAVRAVRCGLRGRDF